MTRAEAIKYLNEFIIFKKISNTTEDEAIECFKLAVDALEQQSKADKALNLLVRWVTDCDFGFDNIPEEYEKYKDDIAEMGYREGLVYIVKMESEVEE